VSGPNQICHEETESCILIYRVKKACDALRPLSDYRFLEKDYTDGGYVIAIIILIMFQALQRLNSGHASLLIFLSSMFGCYSLMKCFLFLFADVEPNILFLRIPSPDETQECRQESRDIILYRNM
jgi:hypothetical protein